MLRDNREKTDALDAAGFVRALRSCDAQLFAGWRSHPGLLDAPLLESAELQLLQSNVSTFPDVSRNGIRTQRSHGNLFTPPPGMRLRQRAAVAEWTPLLCWRQDLPLRLSLAQVEAELGQLPPVQPDVASLLQLQSAVDAVPLLSPWLTRLGLAQTAAEAVPDTELVQTP